MTFRVLHAPLHGPSAAKNPRTVTRAIDALNATTVGLTEAGRPAVRRALREVPGYRLVLEGGGDPRGQRECVILVDDAAVSHGSGQVKACDPAEPKRLAGMERWFTWSTIELLGNMPGPVMHIAVHTHPVVQNKATGDLGTSARSMQAAASFVVLSDLLEFGRAMGWAPLVTGDVNWRDRPTSGPSPYKVLRSHGLRVEGQGLDVIAAPPELGLEVSEVNPPPGVKITDHPWLLGVAR